MTAAATPWQRRRARFRAHRRAYFALILFGILCILSLAADLIANDRPLLVMFDGEIRLPILRDYAETDYGGVFPTSADYRDPVVQALIDAKGWAVWPPIAYGPDSINYALPAPAPTPPSAENWLGTDAQGRDVLARLLHGFRLSLLFALLLTGLSAIIGVAAGTVQGYFGGWVDLAFQRMIEVWQGLPALYLLIILASLVQPTFGWLLGILLLFHWLGLVGVVRAEVLRTRDADYVRAARALGAGPVRLMLVHVLPNAMVATLTVLPFMLNGAIASLTALDFLGFGLPPGSASLGELLAQGKANLSAPWLGITAFLALGTLLSLLVFIGEGLRDALDPRQGGG